MSHGAGSAQNSSMIIWKWFIQDLVNGRTQRGDTPKEDFSPRTDAGIVGRARAMNSPLLGQQPINSSQQTKSYLVCVWQFQGEWTTSCLEGHHLDGGRGKQISSQARFCAVFLAVIEDLNSGQSPHVWIFTDSVANGLTI